MIASRALKSKAMKRSILFVLLFVVVAAAHGQTDDVVYVRTPNTALHEAPSGTAPVKTRLKSGMVLEVVATKDRWIEVSCDAGRGYVFAAKTASEPPPTSDPLWDDELEDMAAVDAPEATTAQGIRGLSKTANEHAQRDADVKPEHVQQLERLEKVHVSEEELDRFLKQGRLAEYAR